MGINEDSKDTGNRSAQDPGGVHVNFYFSDNGVTLEAVKEKKVIIRTEEEVKKMATKQYLDEMVVPILNKALLKINKEVKEFDKLVDSGMHLFFIYF